MIKLEVCVDTARCVLNAANGGADRAELCSALSVGGLTPSAGLIDFAAKAPIRCHAMVRPRPGNFEYEDHEIDQMMSDISYTKSAGIEGVVFGALTPKSTLDEDALARLIELSAHMDKTLHRAFDLTPDPLQALETAIDLGFDRILTSGQRKNACEGRTLIAELHEKAAGRIEIMPGSGVRSENVAQLISETGVRSVHSSCASEYLNSNAIIEMEFGGQYERRTDIEKVRKMRKTIDEISAR